MRLTRVGRICGNPAKTELLTMIEFKVYEKTAARIRAWIYYRNHAALRRAILAAREVC